LEIGQRLGIIESVAECEAEEGSESGSQVKQGTQLEMRFRVLFLSVLMFAFIFYLFPLVLIFWWGFFYN